MFEKSYTFRITYTDTTPEEIFETKDQEALRAHLRAQAPGRKAKYTIPERAGWWRPEDALYNFPAAVLEHYRFSLKNGYSVTDALNQAATWEHYGHVDADRSGLDPWGPRFYYEVPENREAAARLILAGAASEQ